MPDPAASSSTLQEASDLPAERLVQAIWCHQRLRRDQLRTVDGRSLRVLHPGFWNRGPGPDFRGAMVQFGDDAPRSLDVEVDLHGSGWWLHRHDVNPAFRDVGLHVVWRPEGLRDGELPTLVLSAALDAPLEELAETLAGEVPGVVPLEFVGRCCAPLRDCPRDQLRTLLREAGLARWQARGAWIHARAREAGWEQALWEALFRGLGYRHNAWPMQRMAELRGEFLSGASAPMSVLQWEALLLGVANLLPPDWPARGDHRHVRALWDVWWRERDRWSSRVLPRALWRLGGVRPANHPQRRLALAARWLAAGDLPARLLDWALASCPRTRLRQSLAQVLQPGPDEFWSRHWTLTSARTRGAQSLLGLGRLTDLAVNAILPWLWVRAAEGRQEALCGEIERRYLAWPGASDNAVLRLARLRLLGGGVGPPLWGAAAQQGLLQIVRQFCEHSNALCGECRFPEMVRRGPPGPSEE
ncbi:MAG: hypothetical protein RJA22_776 [Verrucomicrobiota bacterium]